MNNKRLSNPGIILTLAMVLLSSCVSKQSTEPSSTPAPSATPQATGTPAPLVTVKVATYNILYGAGRDRSNDERISDPFKGIDRSPLLIDYLTQLDADILGLQEATGWDTGDTPYIQTLSQKFGMNYFISTRPEADSALMTKYPILEAEELSNDYNSIIRASLQGPDGEPIHVFVAHLDSGSADHRTCGVEFLLQEMAPYVNQMTILMGDMNFRLDWNEWGSEALQAQGWRIVAIEGKLGIDQIWAVPSMQWQVTDWNASVVDNLRKISDHLPVGRELQIYSPTGELAPLPVPTALPDVSDLPSAVTEKLTNVRVVFDEQASSLCKSQAWEAGWINESYIKKELRLFGKPDWQSGANWSAPMQEDGGILLDFKYNPGTQFNIFLEHSTWAQPDYHRFGMYIVENVFQSDMWMSETPLGGDLWSIPRPKPDTWYRLLLTADKAGHLEAWVWEVEDPSNITSYVRDMEEGWENLSWRLSAGANQGRVYIKNVKQIVFDVAR